MGKRWPHFFDHAGNSGVIAGDSIALSSIREIRGGVSLRSAHASRSVCLPPLKRCSFATGPYLIWIEAASVPGSADTAEGLSQGGGPPHRGGEKSREKLHMCEEETMIKFKFLALVMLASALGRSPGAELDRWRCPEATNRASVAILRLSRRPSAALLSGRLCARLPSVAPSARQRGANAPTAA